MTYTPEQLREKDAWIAEHVFGAKWFHCRHPESSEDRRDFIVMPKDSCEFLAYKEIYGEGRKYKRNKIKTHWVEKFTTDPAASDALDDKILEKLRSSGDGVTAYCDDGLIYMESRNRNWIEAEHPDKKICRVLFAEKLWRAK